MRALPFTLRLKFQCPASSFLDTSLDPFCRSVVAASAEALENWSSKPYEAGHTLRWDYFIKFGNPSLVYEAKTSTRRLSETQTHQSFRRSLPASSTTVGYLVSEFINVPPFIGTWLQQTNSFLDFEGVSLLPGSFYSYSMHGTTNSLIEKVAKYLPGRRSPNLPTMQAGKSLLHLHGRPSLGLDEGGYPTLMAPCIGGSPIETVGPSDVVAVVACHVSAPSSPVAVATAADDLIDLTGLRHVIVILAKSPRLSTSVSRTPPPCHRVGTHGEADPRPQPHEYLADPQTQRISTIPVSPPRGSLLFLHATWPSLCVKYDQSSFERMTSSLLAHAYGSVNPPYEACRD
ncbi:hypothetical protein BGW80DRAFT_1456223 [Lactifluus volemus]|nr:hypothetical protein BGW80DRAFT_1456223 [Lactifluus volemus]